MKFSHSIQFNAVPDWSSYYISYSNLKKLIYQLEKQLHSSIPGGKADPQDAESSPLLTSSTGGLPDDPDKVFTRKLDDELEKICSFYQLKELEIHGEVDGLLKDVDEFQAEHAAGEALGEGLGVRRQSVWARARQQSIFKNFQIGGGGGSGGGRTSSRGGEGGRKRRSSTMGTAERVERGIPEEDEEADGDGGDDSEDDANHDNSTTPLTKSQNSLAPPRRHSAAPGSVRSEGGAADHHSSTELRRRPSTAFNDFDTDALDALYSEGVTLKKRITNLYVSVCELRSYIQLNETGFSKVLKKYDKILDRNLKSNYLREKVKPAHPFQPSTVSGLNDHLARIEEAYAGIVTAGDVEAARKELRLHLREHVVWERNTVWREMIGIERKAQAANLGIRGTMLGRDTDKKNARLQGDDPEATTKEVQTPVGKYTCPKFLLSSTFWVLVMCVAVFAVLLGVRFMEDDAQQNCLAMVIFVSLLWATEVSHERALFR